MGVRKIMGFIKSKWQASKFEEKIRDTKKSIPMGDAVTWTENTDPIYTKVIELGSWDMDTVTTKTISHGLGSNYKKIRLVFVIIQADNLSITNYQRNDSVLGAQPAGFIGDISQTGIALAHPAGGMFDTANFDDTSINRGWMTIHYEE